MREFLTILEQSLMEGFFDPTAVYLHGGPSELVGGRLKRYGRGGRDMGGLFFVKDTPNDRRYAATYPASQPDGGAVYTVRINLSADEVFDLSNPAHRAELKKAVSPQEFESYMKAASGGALDWAAMPDEETFEDLGFKGAILAERPPGFAGNADHIRSIVVFDAGDVEITGTLSGEEVDKALRSLNEDAQADFARVAEARRIVKSLVSWLNRVNETTPISKVPGAEFQWFPKRRIQGYIFSPETTGVGYDDLYFGVGAPLKNEKANVKALFVRGKDDGKDIGVVLVVVRDAVDAVDLSFEIDWNVVVHEIVHYLDYARAPGLGDRKRASDTKGYYNDPAEMNAFFSQGVDRILESLARAAQAAPRHQKTFFDKYLSSPDVFNRYFMIDFSDGWREHLTPENRRKFSKRLARLYLFIREKWPEIDAVQDLKREWAAVRDSFAAA